MISLTGLRLALERKSWKYKPGVMGPLQANFFNGFGQFTEVISWHIKSRLQELSGIIPGLLDQVISENVFFPVSRKCGHQLLWNLCTAISCLRKVTRKFTFIQHRNIQLLLNLHKVRDSIKSWFEQLGPA